MILPQLAPLGQPGQAPIVDKEGRPTPQFAQFLTSLNTILTALKNQSTNFFVQGATNPTGTTSTTGVMMGLGSTFQFGPKQSNNILVEMSFQAENNTIGDGWTTSMVFGTGTPPVNGAAPTGSGFGGAQTMITNPVGGYVGPVTMFGILSGLVIGTTYWFDIELLSRVGGTSTIFNPFIMIHELW